MSQDRIDPKQQLVLWSLAARGGSALLSELQPRLDPKERRALEAGKLVTSVREGRALRVELGDAGWRALGEGEPRLIGERETRVPAERHLLQALLGQLTRFMRDEKIIAGQIFRPRETKAAAAPTEAKPRRRKTTAATSPPARKADIEAAIRAACREIAGHPAREAVRLSALRAKLPDIHREKLDAALLAMRKAGHANLMNLDNPRDIAPETEAALTSGLHTYHVVWID